MSWTLTVKPSNTALTLWEWEALRADQNIYRNGFGEPSSADAMEAARAAATQYELHVAQIENNKVTETFTPVID